MERMEGFCSTLPKSNSQCLQHKMAEDIAYTIDCSGTVN